jgi:hypothetical protein
MLAHDAHLGLLKQNIDLTKYDMAYWQMHERKAAQAFAANESVRTLSSIRNYVLGTSIENNMREAESFSSVCKVAEMTVKRGTMLWLRGNQPMDVCWVPDYEYYGFEEEAEYICGKVGLNIVVMHEDPEGVTMDKELSIKKLLLREGLVSTRHLPRETLERFQLSRYFNFNLGERIPYRLAACPYAGWDAELQHLVGVYGVTTESDANVNTLQQVLSKELGDHLSPDDLTVQAILSRIANDNVTEDQRVMMLVAMGFDLEKSTNAIRKINSLLGSAKFMRSTQYTTRDDIVQALDLSNAGLDRVVKLERGLLDDRTTNLITILAYLYSIFNVVEWGRTVWVETLGSVLAFLDDTQGKRDSDLISIEANDVIKKDALW